MNILVVGCGHISEYYLSTLDNYPGLRVVGGCDRNAENLAKFTKRWNVPGYTDLDDALARVDAPLILNLTNPRSHFDINKRCLEAGKHVYSEKPLTMISSDARELVQLAEEKGVCLASAPCSLLGDTAQTMWKAIKSGVVGQVRLVYANFDDGMIAPRQAPWLWLNRIGVPWPARDEFEVGCTYEHAGYLLTWLAAFFGPARRVTAFSSCQVPDKGIPVDGMAPDFSVGCIEYDNQVVARVTCSLVAPRDKSLIIVGDDGIIFTPYIRNDRSPVFVKYLPGRGLQAGIERRLNDIQRWLDSRIGLPWAGKNWSFVHRYPSARESKGRLFSSAKPVDFCRGPAELVQAIEQKRPCRLSARLGLHVVELIETLQYPERFDWRRDLHSTFDPIDPLPWNGS